MSFLQPWLLAALPLASIPIIIHLINQRRFQTIRWGAMMFLLAANRMSRGYARLRQWLILLFRVLGIMALVFAISRPLASGWLGMAAGGGADTTIILLDRSPSMHEQGSGGGGSKLQTGRQRLVETLELLRSARWVLIDSANAKPRELQSPGDLLRLPEAEGVSASADIPALLEEARDYVKANKTGRTEIWICSDLRQNDWNAESGRWQAIRDSFLEFSQAIRFHLLAYEDTSPANSSIRVTNVRRLKSGDGAELLVSLRIDREKDRAEKVTVPVQLEIDGARSEIAVEVEGTPFELKDHRIPIDRRTERGWGKVSIPADANPGDNEFYFVFSPPPERRSIIVSDNADSVYPLQLAASISSDVTQQVRSEVVAPDQLAALEWEQIGLLLWQAPIPSADDQRLIDLYVERGGQIIFFPPQSPTADEYRGISWGEWVRSEQDLPLETWRSDQDLLRNALSGAALPVGQLQVRNYCELRGEATPLASLRGNAPLLVRVPTTRGGIYFCATSTAGNDSTLANNGVVLYVLVQRALASGSESLGSTRQLVAGSESTSAVEWQPLAANANVLSTEFGYQAGVYSWGDKLIAVNRSELEDRPATLSNSRLTELFQSLDFHRVDDRAGGLAQLVQEIWRMFLITMALALVVEAALCLPRITRPTGAAA